MKSASALAGVLMLLLPVPGLQAAPQQPIGSTLVVVNLVTAAFNRDTRTLQTGDRVHQDELIEVGRDASSELKLDDETKLALGPGSRLMLDKFVYDPAKAKGSIVLDLVKGSFRFITGVAEKPTYVIKTPSAAITVRGTMFDVYVEDEDDAWLLLLEGAIQVCNARGECQDLTEPGKLIRISGDTIGRPSKWAALSGEDSVPFDDAFPFVSKAPSIDPTPILTRDVIILGKLPEADPPKKRTETTPPKKRTERTPPKTKEKAKATKTKKKTAKKGGPSDEQVMRGVGTAIGIGLAIGLGKGKGGKHRGGGMGTPGGRTMGNR